MSLYDILACPTCRVGVTLEADYLLCPRCACRYPIVKGVPIMLPGGRYDEVNYQFGMRLATTYDPWVHRMILQSLSDAQVVVDVGSGDMALDDPCIIRMDIKLTPHVDLVADFHALPFLPDTVDYIFSLAVFEHLRQPFVAAEEIWRVLKPGGYVYAEANFVYAYHGYPHHYFNISIQGFEQLFARFTQLKTGVPPYHQPSFALDFVLATYLEIFRPDTPDEHELADSLRRILQHPLHDYDRKLLPDEAYRIAAGNYLIGLKEPTGGETLIPPVVRELYESSAALQARFPNPTHIFQPDNLLYWALTDGRQQHAALADYYAQLKKFSKYSEPARGHDRTAVRQFEPIPAIAENWVKDTRRLPNGAGNGPTWRYWLYKTWYHFCRAEFHLIWLKVLATVLPQHRR